MYRVIHGLCDKPLEVCLQLTDGGAKYAEEQGVGRRLTLDEGYGILRVAEEAGLVPTVFGGDKVGFICLCDDDCCGNIRIATKTDYYVLDKSRYQSTVDPELCNGCQTCVERCPFSAIEMKTHPIGKRMKAFVHTERCYGCGACAVKCPIEGAVTLKLVRPKEHIPLLEIAHLQV
jgi:ferredoxin